MGSPGTRRSGLAHRLCSDIGVPSAYQLCSSCISMWPPLQIPGRKEKRDETERKGRPLYQDREDILEIPHSIPFIAL